VDNSSLVKPQPVQKKGFFEKMSGTQKIILVILVILVVLILIGVFMGGITSFYQLFFYGIIFVGVVVAAYIVILAAGAIFTPSYFSPRQEFKQQIENLAKDYKGKEVRDLYFLADGMRQRVKAGKIVGYLGLPNYVGDIAKYDKDVLAEDGSVVHRKGDIVFTDLRDPLGKAIPKYKNIRASGDGDTLFVVRAGGLIMGKTHFIRCAKNMHSAIIGDVDIYDINPVPYGFFEYPYKQMQLEVGKIQMQNQLETIIATQEHQLDYISQVADASIWFNPMFRMAMKQQAEMPAQE
jgi:hypothetical protein